MDVLPDLSKELEKIQGMTKPRNLWTLQAYECAKHQETESTRTSPVGYVPVPKTEHQAAKILLSELCVCLQWGFRRQTASLAAYLAICYLDLHCYNRFGVSEWSAEVKQTEMDKASLAFQSRSVSAHGLCQAMGSCYFQTYPVYYIKRCWLKDRAIKPPIFLHLSGGALQQPEAYQVAC